MNDKNPNKSRAHYEGMLKEAGLPITDENVFITAACGAKGIAFLEGKAKIGVRYKETPKESKPASNNYQIKIDNEDFTVELKEGKAIVNGQEYQISDLVACDGSKEATVAPQKNGGSAQIVEAKMPGIIAKILVKEGDKVAKGQNILVVEVMKMETFVTSPSGGTVGKIFVQTGEQVETNKKLLEVL